MKNVMILVLGIIGWLGACPISGPRDVMDIEVVVMDTKVPPHPFQTEYEKMLYPTVRISSPSGTGSGVIISHRDTEVTETAIYVLTAAHVVENESKVTVEIFYPKTIEIESEVIITDTTKDLALLRVLCDSVATATLAPRNYTPYIFTPVYTVGCSLGLLPRPSAGMITAIFPSPFPSPSRGEGRERVEGNDLSHWEVSSPILPGNSGGPVYDAHTFEVIGIAVWVKVYNGQLITTMAGIVPINEIYEFLEGYKRLQ